MCVCVCVCVYIGLTRYVHACMCRDMHNALTRDIDTGRFSCASQIVSEHIDINRCICICKYAHIRMYNYIDIYLSTCPALTSSEYIYIYK